MGWQNCFVSSLVCVSVFLFVSPAPYYDDFSDLPGQYCAGTDITNDLCCDGREDTCSVPILGTRCYCDDFCNNTRVNDCCPDYWRICKGIPGPLIKVSCPVLNGKTEGETTDNCNSCTCIQGKWLCTKKECLIDSKIIDTINRGDYSYGWTASNYSHFWGKTLDYGVEYRLGTLPPQRFVLKMNPIKWIYDPNTLPTEFDAERRWPGLISGIQDQKWCASSWAVSTAAVASDRYAIFSQGLEKVTLSAQNLISCNTKGQENCKGGHLDRAWSFVRLNGLVDEDCFPYQGTNMACSIRRKGRLLDAGCSPPPYKDRKNRYTVSPAYRLGNETDIMYDITRSGPVQATMKVYHDFFMYKGGIYRHTDLGSTEPKGYHSVRIVGWGEEDTDRGFQKYWKVANSWGPHWGENGYFRIARGTNESEIESFVLAVWPHVDRKIFITKANEI